MTDKKTGRLSPAWPVPVPFIALAPDSGSLRQGCGA